MVSLFLRKVETASGATVVQIAVKEGRRDKVIEHLGSAHTQAELAALMEIGWTAGCCSGSACLCFRLPSLSPGIRVRLRSRGAVSQG